MSPGMRKLLVARQATRSFVRSRSDPGDVGSIPEMPSHAFTRFHYDRPARASASASASSAASCSGDSGGP